MLLENTAQRESFPRDRERETQFTSSTERNTAENSRFRKRKKKSGRCSPRIRAKVLKRARLEGDISASRDDDIPGRRGVDITAAAAGDIVGRVQRGLLPNPLSRDVP